ncbi:MAG TPA: zinc ribbon domain-containing protein [Chthonomonadaceae bacterium]|nr:zinc ribbon domain-containing protein [Chthonomonadaceae bacterium]
MQCPNCQLENEPGALYCARCHTALPRPPAPGECPYCGRVPEPGELPPAVCPSCGNDPERGKQVREQRLAALRAEVQQQSSMLEAQRQALLSRKQKKGCGGTLLLCGLIAFACVWGHRTLSIPKVSAFHTTVLPLPGRERAGVRGEPHGQVLLGTVSASAGRRVKVTREHIGPLAFR